MRKRIDVRLPPSLIAEADARARSLGATRTELIERGLRHELGAVVGIGPAQPPTPEPRPATARGHSEPLLTPAQARFERNMAKK